MCQGCFAAGVQLAQLLLRQVYTAGQRQKCISPLLTKSDDTDSIPLFISITEQGQNCTFHHPHPVHGTHGSAGIHQKQNRGACALFPNLHAEIITANINHQRTIPFWM